MILNSHTVIAKQQQKLTYQQYDLRDVELSEDDKLVVSVER